MILPGGGIAPDGSRWISSRPAFLLPVRVLGALFRRLFLTRLIALVDAGKVGFFGTMAGLAERKAFCRHIDPVHNKRWIVYAKPPFAEPQAVLAYLSRYTHRVAISNRRLIAFNKDGVTFRYKDYRRGGQERQQIMTLATDEFIHRIRHYGLLSSSTRKLLGVAAPLMATEPDEPPDNRPACPCCGGHMTVIEAFARWYQPRAPPTPSICVRETAP